MKKLILPIILIISFLFFLPQKTYSQVGPECMKIFDKEMKDCTTDFNTCSDACMKKTEKPDGGAYINSGEIYPKCMKTSDCDGKSSACKEQSLANYRACGKFDKKPVAADAKQETLKQETKSVAQVVNDWIMENNLMTDTVQLEQMEREKLDFELYGRTPQMTEETIRQYQEEWNKMFEPSENQTITPFRARADILKGEAEIKYPGKDEWVSLKQGDVVPLGATLFTGMDTTLVFSIQDKGVFQMLPFTEITVSEENIKENSHTDIKLNRGEIEVSIPGGVYTGTLQITTPSSTTSVRGTHFWVSYDKNKRVAVTGVYEGKVEMKDTNGVTLVAPSGGKPGIAVVMQKLSTIRLAVIGMVLAVAAGGVIWFIKKRTIFKSSKKR